MKPYPGCGSNPADFTYRSQLYPRRAEVFALPVTPTPGRGVQFREVLGPAHILILVMIDFAVGSGLE
jgi:hypothetical protein